MILLGLIPYLNQSKVLAVGAINIDGDGYPDQLMQFVNQSNNEFVTISGISESSEVELFRIFFSGKRRKLTNLLFSSLHLYIILKEE